MIIGTLGDIVFEVSSKTIMTINKFSRSKSATFQSHSVHLRTGLLEFTGSEPESLSISIKISRYLGADPIYVYSKIAEYQTNGTAVSLVIGSEIYGSYKWVVSKCKAAYNYYDRFGNVTDMDVSLTLTEYVKE